MTTRRASITRVPRANGDVWTVRWRVQRSDSGSSRKGKMKQRSRTFKTKVEAEEFCEQLQEAMKRRNQHLPVDEGWLAEITDAGDAREERHIPTPVDPPDGPSDTNAQTQPHSPDASSTLAVNEQSLQSEPPTADELRDALTQGAACPGWEVRQRIEEYAGFGNVYLLEATARGGEFGVLKLCHESDPNTMRAYQLYSSISKQTQHLVPVFDEGKVGDWYWFRMPAADSRNPGKRYQATTLQSLIDSRSRKANPSLSITTEHLITGLQELQDLGIIEADVDFKQAQLIKGNWCLGEKNLVLRCGQLLTNPPTPTLLHFPTEPQPSVDIKALKTLVRSLPPREPKDKMVLDIIETLSDEMNPRLFGESLADITATRLNRPQSRRHSNPDPWVLGRHALAELRLIRVLTHRVLTKLSQFGITRARCYLLRKDERREALYFDGLCELGASDNFRRVSIPIYSDSLSQLLLAEKCILAHRRQKPDDYVASYGGSPTYKAETRVFRNLRTSAHDLQALGRENVNLWLDIPLLAPRDESGGRSNPTLEVVGKITCMWDEGPDPDPCSEKLWKLALEGGELISGYNHGHLAYPEYVCRQLQDAPRRSEIYRAALRRIMFDDHSRTVLSELLRGQPANPKCQFQRARLYVTSQSEHALFGPLLRCIYKNVPPPELQGFWGHVSSGNTKGLLFSDLFIPTTADIPNWILLEEIPRQVYSGRPYLEDYWVIQARAKEGFPILFTDVPEAHHPEKLKCYVRRFFSPEPLTRKHIRWSVDLPLLSPSGEIVGKCTLDDGRGSESVPNLSDPVIERLMQFGRKAGAVLAGMADFPNQQLHKHLEERLSRC